MFVICDVLAESYTALFLYLNLQTVLLLLNFNFLLTVRQKCTCLETSKEYKIHFQHFSTNNVFQ